MAGEDPGEEECMDVTEAGSGVGEWARMEGTAPFQELTPRGQEVSRPLPGLKNLTIGGYRSCKA